MDFVYWVIALLLLIVAYCWPQIAKILGKRRKIYRITFNSRTGRGCKIKTRGTKTRYYMGIIRVPSWLYWRRLMKI